MGFDIKKYDPAVDKRLLILLSGLLWSVVGVMLCMLAYKWLSITSGVASLYFVVSGAALALLIHHFGFLKLVDKNVKRISSYKEKACLFAFQERKSYLIIAVMICLGVILRHSPLPKPYLSVIYIGFGGAMILSSIKYFRLFVRLMLAG
ncbi:MAG: hypothetical protein HY809_00220 [Nitrospirae bacterium]|nr:hypothetical protein [Nitrospirota bacterium]